MKKLIIISTIFITTLLSCDNPNNAYPNLDDNILPNTDGTILPNMDNTILSNNNDSANKEVQLLPNWLNNKTYTSNNDFTASINNNNFILTYTNYNNGISESSINLFEKNIQNIKDNNDNTGTAEVINFDVNTYENFITIKASVKSEFWFNNKTEYQLFITLTQDDTFLVGMTYLNTSEPSNSTEQIIPHYYANKIFTNDNVGSVFFVNNKIYYIMMGTNSPLLIANNATYKGININNNTTTNTGIISDVNVNITDNDISISFKDTFGTMDFNTHYNINKDGVLTQI